MTIDLSGRVAVITGASRGLGAGMAEVFAGRGLKLGLCSRTAPVLAASDDVVAETVDVVDGEAVDRFCAAVAGRFGAIDLWINNAGILEPIDQLRAIESAEFRRHLDVNVLGVFHGTRAFVRHLRSTARPGVLLNISSGAARAPYSGWSAYCAGKAAVDRMTEVVALEESEAGLLTAYSVAPGIINTDMQALIRQVSADRFPEVERFKQLVVDDAFSTAESVAEALLELAFDPATARDEVSIDLRR
jgi:NAD(P)-dependent dehydrogenase (short-subunit alcohol dehydrogenase family)